MNIDDKLQQIKDRLYQRIFSDTTRVFTVSDFWPEMTFLTGDNALIKKALDLLVEEHDNFFKLSDKIYHRARWLKWMECWSAAPECESTKAIMRRDGHKTLMTGAIAANGLGLSTQVPAKIIYITDGPSRIEKIGGWDIDFQHADDNVMFWANHPAAIVIQALHWMGQPWVEANQDLVITRLRGSSWKNDTIPEPVKKDLQDNIAQVPEWMQPIIQDVVNTSDGCT